MNHDFEALRAQHERVSISGRSYCGLRWCGWPWPCPTRVLLVFYDAGTRPLGPSWARPMSLSVVLP